MVCRSRRATSKRPFFKAVIALSKSSLSGWRLLTLASGLALRSTFFFFFFGLSAACAGIIASDNARTQTVVAKRRRRLVEEEKPGTVVLDWLGFDENRVMLPRFGSICFRPIRLPPWLPPVIRVRFARRCRCRRQHCLPPAD